MPYFLAYALACKPSKRKKVHSLVYKCGTKT